MKMGEESPITALVLPILVRPILDKLERKDVTAAQQLKLAISKVEAAHTGFVYDLVMGLVRRAELSVNMAESLLKLQGSIPDTNEYKCSRPEDSFQELNRKSSSLKKILSRIPDEINDRKTFLETIKEIASAIKKLLDAVNEVSGYIPSPTGKQALEQRKREFVKYSKRFSNTLKDFFREGQAQSVFVSAIYLIHQTNLIMLTVKSKCD
ncbi:programmed cell death protein 10-like [Centruroides sculpturatus]|uniref:programmed cell death protein 10-like n=1 Tax=Centruroides sculpturatus TaxID=218467 RepID=UPI000C6E3F7C|nr:programmed cell death protein 10-like [Centruroides sculpturatus]